jgi:hypothetical protein
MRANIFLLGQSLTLTFSFIFRLRKENEMDFGSGVLAKGYAIYGNTALAVEGALFIRTDEGESI